MNRMKGGYEVLDYVYPVAFPSLNFGEVDHVLPAFQMQDRYPLSNSTQS